MTKSVAGFTPMTPDQGIEQENRTLKVIGGIVRITQSEKALANYFIIAPELSKLLHELAAEYDSDNNDTEKNATPHNHRREAISNDEECSETDRCTP